MMAKKKRRDCLECIAYCNMLGGPDYKCGLGFDVVEDAEGGDGFWRVVVYPDGDKCEAISIPKTKEEFVRTAAQLGIEWDINEVVTEDDIY